MDYLRIRAALEGVVEAVAGDNAAADAARATEAAAALYIQRVFRGQLTRTRLEVKR